MSAVKCCKALLTFERLFIFEMLHKVLPIQ